MSQIHVDVVSPEEAANGNAELWLGRELIGVTTFVDSALRLELRATAPEVVWAASPASLHEALDEAARLIAEAG